MDFDKYTSRIRMHMKVLKQTRFQNKKGNIIMVTIEKSEFGQLNDKRSVLCDGISSLPYRHKDLIPIEKFKKGIKLMPQSLIKNHENNLLRFEQGIIQGNERIRNINSVLLQCPIFYKKGMLKRSQFQIEFSMRDFLLKGSQRKI